MRSIMPFAQPRPPEATIAGGVIGAGWGVYSGTGLFVALGVLLIGMGVSDLWRARRRPE